MTHTENKQNNDIVYEDNEIKIRKKRWRERLGGTVANSGELGIDAIENVTSQLDSVDPNHLATSLLRIPITAIGLTGKEKNLISTAAQKVPAIKKSLEKYGSIAKEPKQEPSSTASKKTQPDQKDNTPSTSSQSSNRDTQNTASDENYQGKGNNLNGEEIEKILQSLGKTEETFSVGMIRAKANSSQETYSLPEESRKKNLFLIAESQKFGDEEIHPLEDSIQFLKEQNMQGTHYIIYNEGKHHWRTAQVTLKNSKVSALNVYNSAGNNEGDTELGTSQLPDSLQRELHQLAPKEYMLAQQQKDSSTCGIRAALNAVALQALNQPDEPVISARALQNMKYDEKQLRQDFYPIYSDTNGVTANHALTEKYIENSGQPKRRKRRKADTEPKTPDTTPRPLKKNKKKRNSEISL